MFAYEIACRHCRKDVCIARSSSTHSTRLHIRPHCTGALLETCLDSSQRLCESANCFQTNISSSSTHRHTNAFETACRQCHKSLCMNCNPSTRSMILHWHHLRMNAHCITVAQRYHHCMNCSNRYKTARDDARLGEKIERIDVFVSSLYLRHMKRYNLLTHSNEFKRRLKDECKECK